MTTPHILVETADRILTLRLNRPDKKNALTAAMYTAMDEALAHAQAAADVRVVLLCGQPDCFTSGNDIADFLQRPPVDETSPTARFMTRMLAVDKPIVAAVNGPAIGVGATLLLHCDLVYAGANARLQMPFVNIGVCPEFGSSHLLPRLMGHQRASELLLLGEPFSAQTAREFGIVNAVCDGDAEAPARAAALKLAQQPPAALRATKALIRRATSAPVGEAMRAEASLFLPMLQGGEAREAMTAFMQKRKPDFTRFA